ncbi:outer membrane protein transport protein [Flammeovirga pacifica]|nr:outer membrane protein transport protein [Flammeovirga pacifica]
MRHLFTFTLILFPFICAAQGNFYWQQQQGANGNLLGGSLSAGVNDNSAIFYNPGALAFTETPNVSFTSDLIGYTIVDIKNGAGDGIHIKMNTMETKPQMVAGTAFKLDKKNFKVTYAIINLLNSKQEYNSQNIGIDPESNALYEGYFNYKSSVRNDRFAVGTTFRVNDKLGIGITHFVDIKNAQITNNTNQTWSNNNEITNYHIDYKNVRFNQVSILWKLGVAWLVNNNFNLGFNFETQDIRLPFLSKSNLIRTLDTKDEQGNIHKVVSSQEKIYSKYKHPFTADINLGYHTNKSEISCRIGYFGPIDRYGIFGMKDEQSVFAPQNVEFGQYWVANKQIVNIAIGFKNRLFDKINLLSGFRTDFNNLDDRKINPTQENILSYEYWDLYHISSGVEWFGPRFNVIAGIVSDLGFSKGDPQLVNLNARPYKELNDINYNTEAMYLQFNLVFGITYHFKDRTQL